MSPPQMRGEAEAFALEAKGRAEAEQMSKKAEAFKQYKDGAMVDMLLEKLPLVSRMILLIGSFLAFKSCSIPLRCCVLEQDTPATNCSRTVWQPAPIGV